MPYCEASPLKPSKIFLIFKSQEHSWIPAALVGMLSHLWPSMQSGGFLPQSLAYTFKEYDQIMFFLSLGKDFSSSV